MGESPAQSTSMVAVFDTKTIALRAINEAASGEVRRHLAHIVRGETDDSETIVCERGTPAALLHRFDGILPPNSAALSLRADANVERANFIIEVAAGGHIDH